MEYCTYPKCKCLVLTSTSEPNPGCVKDLAPKPAQSNSSTAIDELGKIRAQLAELKIKEDELKRSIIEMGPGAHEGELFRASVIESSRANFDVAWAKKKLGKKQVAAHTTYTSFVSVRLVARTGETTGGTDDDMQD